jgi:hypothetical protein
MNIPADGAIKRTETGNLFHENPSSSATVSESTGAITLLASAGSANTVNISSNASQERGLGSSRSGEHEGGWPESSDWPSLMVPDAERSPGQTTG